MGRGPISATYRPFRTTRPTPVAAAPSPTAATGAAGGAPRTAGSATLRAAPVLAPPFHLVPATDDACTALLERLRWPRGFSCPECGGGGRRLGGRRSDRPAWQCRARDCRAETSLTAGSLLAGCRLPPTTVLRAAAVVAADPLVRTADLAAALAVAPSTAVRLRRLLWRAIATRPQPPLPPDSLELLAVATTVPPGGTLTLEAPADDPAGPLTVAFATATGLPAPATAADLKRATRGAPVQASPRLPTVRRRRLMAAVATTTGLGPAFAAAAFASHGTSEERWTVLVRALAGAREA